MAQVGREHFIAVVEELTARWLRDDERELPVRRRAGLIGERALDSYESTAQEGALPDAIAALGAAGALGSELPALRQRLDRLSDVPVPYAAPRSAGIQDRAERDANGFNELLALLRVHAGGSRAAYRAPRPALEAARGYEGEAPGFALVVFTFQMRDALEASLDEAEDPSLTAHIRLSALDRGRLLQSVRTRAADALDQAVDRLQTAVDSSADESRPWGWSFVLGDLAQALLLRYEALGRPSDLERAVDNARTAVRLAQGAGQRDESLLWTGVLGAALRMRHNADDDIRDLKAAADALWETTDLTSLPIAQVARNEWLRAVGAVQRYHFALSGEASYLGRAFETHLGLVGARASHHLRDSRAVFFSPAVYASFGYSCLAMYERSAEPDFLERATDALDNALSQAASEVLGPVEWAEWTGAFVMALRLGFEWQGSPTSLERLITVITRALESPVLPESSAARTAWLGTLGEALLWRYELAGAVGDLSTARVLLGRTRSHAALAAAHHAEYARASDLRALDDAVLAAVAAMRAAMGPDGAHLPTAFELAQCLLARAEVLRAPDDAAVAADLLKHCLEWLDQPSEQLALQTVEYGRALLTLHDVRTFPVTSHDGDEHGGIYALDNAAVTLTEVLVETRFQQTVKARAADLLTRAVALDTERMARAERRGEDDYNRHLDVDVWRHARAVLDERATPDGRPHRPRTTDELRGKAEAIRDELHHRVVDVVMGHPGAGPVEWARLVVAETGVLARWCLEAGEPRAALEVAESGRAVLMAAVTGVDAIGDRITRRGLPTWRAQWLETMRAIHAPENAPQSDAPHRLLPGIVPGHRLLPLPESMRDSIRDALSDVAPAPTPEDISDWCGSMGIDAVVHLLAGRHCGWALVIHRNGRIASLRLPRLLLHAPELVHFAAAHDEQLRARDTRNGPDSPSWRKALRDVCDWAWKAAIEALYEHLTAVGTEDTPRVVVIPSGTLGLVPWHAARHRVKRLGGWAYRFAIESIAFSYAPSAHAMSWYASRALLPLTGSGLVVVDPTQDLPHARQEGEDVYRWYYSKGRRFGASGEPGSVPATPRTVLSALSGPVDAPAPAHSVAHFACHARSLALASDSHLVLASGQRLNVASVLDQLRWENQGSGLAPLVVLSACATAVPGAHYDGALSLATAFGAAGAAAVVGSLWSVDDAMTAALMRDFHTLLNLDGLPPAEALRTAQLRALREARARSWGNSTKARTPASDPSYWAAFVHQGLGHTATPRDSLVSSTVATLPEHRGTDTDTGSASHGLGLRLPIFATLPGPDPAAIVWKCPVVDCSEVADGDMDSPFDADCCPAHPDNAFVSA
ncbi:CHAT domain-containing protein [Streptomyces yunnanensis]|uniref:CHAT domain-containing protein n=1 Tax=Streptomyces yunnanensis TaxID=156453 RepID=A0A9X8N6B9_9ACTN|nr:CHAT domain-containing protein [Streptomyces yunnanensis]SHN14552.1 CHAT domain-containing protein [Streptomyces yunnanensis]